MSRNFLVALTFMSVLVAPAAQARIDLLDEESAELSFSGYMRLFGGYMRPDTEALSLGGEIPEDLGIYATVTRLELKLSAWDWLSLEVHQRFFFQSQSEALGLGSGGFGMGVSTPPTRSLKTRTMVFERARYGLEHDVDRLTLRLFLGDVELSLGRQAVSWGQSNLFPVADVWTTFSPFDLDTSQKRGVDAMRLLWGVNDWVELEMLAVDRGNLDSMEGLEDLGLGLRTTFYLELGDVYVAALKLWEEVGLAAGLNAEVGPFALRSEAMGLYDSEAGEMKLPRLTVGADWFYSQNFMVGAEFHLNGDGASEGGQAGYLSHVLSSKPLGRGEVYLAGRYYAGAYLTYKPHDLVTLMTAAQVNLMDPSAMWTWSVGYDISGDMEVSLGAFHGLGEGLEFGAYGHMVYGQMAAFF